MFKNSRTLKKTHFHNTSQAKSRCKEREEEEYYRKEINRLYELLIRVLDQLAIYNIEISHLERELTSFFFFSDNIIRS